MLYRAIFFIVFTGGGYILGLREGFTYEGVFWGAGVGVLALLIDFVNTRAGLGAMIGGLIGLLVGIVFSQLIYFPVSKWFEATNNIYVPVMLNAIFGYSGLIFGLRQGKDFAISDLIRIIRGGDEKKQVKVIDTSVIIDGRIADVCESGFMEGTFVIPQFILHELQHIADSSDSMRRSRGRRGLDILHKIQKSASISVRIIEKDFPQIKEVDAKLVALAKELDGKILTNDFNLNKVAELQGVQVLNLNELASSLKPVVLPGEKMNIFIAKEGKEPNQGVGYLDDGTMVVVDNARRSMNKQNDVIVTSVLQTTAGRMIFAKLKSDADKEDLKLAK